MPNLQPDEGVEEDARMVAAGPVEPGLVGEAGEDGEGNGKSILDPRNVRAFAPG